MGIRPRRMPIELPASHATRLSPTGLAVLMLYFLDKGYRVIAHDRRGHGRSAQVSDGHDMDHYAADVSAVVELST
jgi:non-heme chloroperoxidase